MTDIMERLRAYSLHPITAEAADEIERLRHNAAVLKDALWKACGDDEAIVAETIESQGELR